MSVAKIWTCGTVSSLGHVFAQQNGDGIGLLAGGAAENPDPELVAAGLALEQLGNDLSFQNARTPGGRGRTG